MQVTSLTDKLTWVKYNDFKRQHNEKKEDFKVQSERLQRMKERENDRIQPRK